jgi:glucuronate isomerase
MEDNLFAEEFLLESKSAQILYNDFAKDLPIIDYHCHISPQEIVSDRKFENIAQIWLHGDHYKWRVMRTNGVAEKYCTGDASDYEKFMKWAETVPYTVRNPLFHWTHMELKNPFGIKKLLNPKSADEIYHQTNEQLQTKFSVRQIIDHFNVEVICTTDDPIDSLEYHKIISQENYKTKLLPAFRPDQALHVENKTAFSHYLKRLSEVADIEITNYNHFIDAIRSRHAYFHENGCSLTDHGIEKIYVEDYTENEMKTIFSKIMAEKDLDEREINKFKSAVLFELASMNHEKGWVQQFHIGALRNANSKMYHLLGPDSGYDCIGDWEVAKQLAKFFDRLDKNNKLTKTIVYNNNPKDNAVIASVIGSFQDGVTPGKLQWGSAWWFLDHKHGIEDHLNTLSNIGLLSRFIGMLTDSRSFLSFSRHDYFRRILCNLIGSDIEKGLLPNDFSLTGQIIKDICYYNAKHYFNF